MVSVNLGVGSAPFEVCGLKGGWGFPEANWGLLTLKTVNRCPAAGTQTANMWPPVSCGTLSSQVVEGSFLHGGSQASLTSHCEDEVGPLRHPGDHVPLTICWRVESVLSAFPSAGFKPASESLPASPPALSLHSSSAFPPFSKAKPPAVPDPVGPASDAF